MKTPCCAAYQTLFIWSEATVPCSLRRCGSGWRGRKPPPASIDDITLHWSCQRIHRCLPRSVRCHRTAKRQDRHQPKVYSLWIWKTDRNAHMCRLPPLTECTLHLFDWCLSQWLTECQTIVLIKQRCGQQRSWFDCGSSKHSVWRENIYIYIFLACYPSCFFYFLFGTNKTEFSSLLKSSLCNVQGLLFF